MKNGKPKFRYNWLAREHYTIEGTEPIPEGKVTLVYDFTYDGGGPHKGGIGHDLREWETGGRGPH